MLKFTAYLCSLTTLVFCVAVAVMMVVGRAVDAQTITAVTSPTRGVENDRVRFHLTDVSRGLSISFKPPLEHVRDIQLLSGKPAALVMVRGIGDITAGSELYHFDLISRKVHPLPGLGQQERLILRIPSWHLSSSPDGRLIAFYNPDNAGIYVTNLETYSTWKVIELEGMSGISIDRYFPISWSRDSRQLSIQHDNKVLVVNVDGSNRREFTNLFTSNSSEFRTLTWSPDGKQITLVGFDGSGTIRIIDAETGSVHPHTIDLEGTSPARSCDGNLLAYIHGLGPHPSAQTELYLLNLEDGTRTNLSTHPVLAEQLLSYTYWSADCEWLVIGSQFSHTDSGYPLTSVYIADPSGKEVHLISHRARILAWRDELIYLTIVEADPDHTIIYSLVPGEEAEPKQITEYTGNYQVVSWFDNGWGLLIEGRFALIQRLGVLDAQTENIRYLTDEGEYVYSYAFWQK